MRTYFIQHIAALSVSAILVACGGGNGADTSAALSQTNERLSLKAVDGPTHSLKANFQGGQGRVYTATAGIDCGAVCEANFVQGSIVSVRAVPAAGYAFERWAEGSACSDYVTCDVTMNGARSVTAIFVPLNPLAECTITRSTASTAQISATHPKILLNNAEFKDCLKSKLALGAPEATRFKNMVDRALAGNKDYGFTPWYAALMYQLTNEARYADYAIAQTDAFIASEEALIASGRAASVAGDSYLEINDRVSNMSMVYDWTFDRLTNTQRSRWIAYGNQAVWNVWKAPRNPNTSRIDAVWGGQVFSWSGWGTDNPANNYYYHFMNAGMHLGLATHGENPQAIEWLDIFRNQKIKNELHPLLDRDLKGGGSREGTGYGTSVRNVWTAYDVWERSTGERIAEKTPHTLASLAHQIHSIVPTLDRMTPTGDHPRDSSAALFDYQRDYLQQLVTLFPNERLSGAAKELLNNSNVPRMRYTFNQYSDFMYSLPKTPSATLTELSTSYWGEGTGQLMMRSAWNMDAAYANFICGPYTESHAHQDQGSFVIYKGDWLAYDSNIKSQSGLEINQEMHNLVRLKTTDGYTIPMTVMGNPCRVMARADTPAYTYVSADVTPIYSFRHATANFRNELVSKVQREFIFIRPSTFVVMDRVGSFGQTQKVWTLNLPKVPTLSPGRISMANGVNQLDVFGLAPANATAAWVDNSRVEVAETSENSVFLNVLGTNGSVAAATRSDTDGNIGARIALADGRIVNLRFPTNSLGGQLEIVGANGQILQSGVLPKNVAQTALYASDAAPTPQPAPALYVVNAPDAPPPSPNPNPNPNPNPSPTPDPTPAPVPTPVPLPADSPAPAAVNGRAFLRQGEVGYRGTSDIGVSNQYAQYNNGKGVVVDAVKTGAYSTTGSDAYEARTFVRFGGLSAYAGRKVIKAQLSLGFDFGSSDYTLDGMYLASAWNANTVDFGWSKRNNGQSWSQAGSGAADWMAGKKFQLTGFTGNSVDVRTSLLDKAVVQSWIDNPQSNHGFVLVATTAGKISFVRSAEDADPANRPTLEIWFEQEPAVPEPIDNKLLLRQGERGYAGALDVGVSNQYVQYNYGRGVVTPAGRTGVYRINGSDAYEARTFMRFGGLGSLAGRKLVKAQLNLGFQFGSSAYTLDGMYLAAPWKPSSANFGWKQRNDNDDWAVSGSGASDWIGNSKFVVSGFTGAALDRRSVVLSTAVVQSWIDNPQTNNGFVLVPTQDNKVSWVRSSEDTNALARPSLELWFE